MIKFGYTILYVAKVSETIAFFERAFGMRRKFITEEEDYGELETGETTLAFASHELASSNFKDGYIAITPTDRPLGIEIALVTSDVDATHILALQHGASEIKSPQKKPWGQVVSYVRCPSGILIELCTPVTS